MSRTTSAVLFSLTLFSLAVRPQLSFAQVTDVEARITSIYRDVYNLDQEAAMAGARSLVAAAPGDSRAHRTLAAVLWIEIIFRRGAVTVDHYLGGVTKSDVDFPKPPPALDAEFKLEVSRAIELADARLRQVPADVQAKFDLGSAYGLQASYQASVEGRMTAAFLSARRAFDAQEDVLTRDPKRVGAGIVVGTYRYMVAGMALPGRMVAYMMGFGGDKERGISLIQSAVGDAFSHVEAKLALVIIYSREGRHADAVRLIGELGAEFPKNRVFVLEQASASLRAGRHNDAEALLTRGIEMFDRDSRRKLPGERALWLYKRGVARTALNRRAEAAADLTAALGASPEDWVRGRIRLGLGKIADLNGQRAAALTEYRLARDIATTAHDAPCATEAARFLKRPFTLLPRS